MFRKSRSTYKIAEPLIAFYQSIMRPQWAAFELGAAQQVWEGSTARFLAAVVCPHFEQMCRDWLATTEGVRPERPARVGSGVTPGSASRDQVQVDVVALSPAWPGPRQRVLSLGEAKWGKRLGLQHLDRLASARQILAGHGLDTSETVLGLYSGTGSDDELRATAPARRDVLLADAARLDE